MDKVKAEVQELYTLMYMKKKNYILFLHTPKMYSLI